LVVIPTIFRDGPFRFYFFSREEPRPHVHVGSPNGEAKFWIEPSIELARNHKMSQKDLLKVQQIVESRIEEISNAWHKHFGT
jgi:hypothetical protein